MGKRGGLYLGLKSPAVGGAAADRGQSDQAAPGVALLSSQFPLGLGLGVGSGVMKWVFLLLGVPLSAEQTHSLLLSLAQAL